MPTIAPDDGREQAAHEHALVAAEHDGTHDHLDRADRDERRGRAFEPPPVEHRTDAEEHDPDDERDRGRRAGGVAGVGQRRVVGQAEVGARAAARDLALERDQAVGVARRTSKVSQLAKKSSAPARKMARPFVHPSR